MAFKPNGVAALPRPNIFAAILEAIYPSEGLFFGTLGKRIFSNGDINEANLVNSPEFSAIFIIPDHNITVGIIAIISSKDFSPLIKIVLFIVPILLVNKLNVIPIIIKKDHI